MRFVPQIRAISVVLGRVPSGIYALGYLAALLSFAGLYTLAAGEFYHATVQHERLATERRWHAERLTAEAIRAQVANSDQRIAIRDGWYTTPDRISVSRLHWADARNPSISLSILLRNDQLNSVAFADVDFDTSESQGYEPSPHSLTVTEFEISGASPSGITSDVLMNELFRPKGYDYQVITLPWAVLSAVADLDRTAHGSAAPDRHTFVRMLYFSAITITTVGYGDIVPLTAYARALVAVEAVLGIVIVGLFLNSIAHEARETERRAV